MLWRELLPKTGVGGRRVGIGGFLTGRMFELLILSILVVRCDMINRELGVIDILETVFPLALAEEDFTEMTGPRITEGSLSGLLVFMDLHNKQVAALQKG